MANSLLSLNNKAEFLFDEEVLTKAHLEIYSNKNGIPRQCPWQKSSASPTKGSSCWENVSDGLHPYCQVSFCKPLVSQVG